jgi:hypothetical protein
MTGKTAVERIGSAVVATYVQIQSKEPKVGLRGKLTPEMIPDLAEFPGKAEDSASGSEVGFQSWKSAIKAHGSSGQEFARDLAATALSRYPPSSC